jgi:hypothetical protein
VSISIFLSSYLFVRVLNRVLYLFSDGTVVELLEGEEDEDDDVTFDTCRELLLYFCFLAIILGHFF